MQFKGLPWYRQNFVLKNYPSANLLFSITLSLPPSFFFQIQEVSRYVFLQFNVKNVIYSMND